MLDSASSTRARADTCIHAYAHAMVYIAIYMYSIHCIMMLDRELNKHTIIKQNKWTLSLPEH